MKFYNLLQIGLACALSAASVLAAPNDSLTARGVSQPHNNYIFEFESGSEEWSFASPAAFTSPIANDSAGSISLTSQDNTNTFGWWESPPFIVGAQENTDDFPLLGSTGPNSLFRTTALVSSNMVNGATMPVLRIRMSTESFEQTDAVTITSVGAGIISPTVAARQYKIYQTLPSNQKRFRVYFDILNFDPTDSPSARFDFEMVEVETLGSSQLFNPMLERTWNFRFANSNGWTQRNAPGLATPFGVAETEGLRMGPSGDIGQVNFAFWGSPESDADAITMEAGRLYRADFVVNSNASLAQKSLVPAFRVRVNDSSNQFSAYQNIESIDSTSRVPLITETQTYTLWFEAFPVLAGNTLNFSFDYLFVPEAINDPNVFVRLESLRLESYLAPF